MIDTHEIMPITQDEMDLINMPNIMLPENSRFFIMKSFCEDDIHKSIKYKIWTSNLKANQIIH